MLLSRKSGCKGTQKNEKRKVKSEKFALGFIFFNYLAASEVCYGDTLVAFSLAICGS